MGKYTVYKRGSIVVATADGSMRSQYKRSGYLDCGDFNASSVEDAIALYCKKRSNLSSKSKSKKNTFLSLLFIFFTFFILFKIFIDSEKENKTDKPYSPVIHNYSRSEIEKMISKNSDDYFLYKDEFIWAANSLIERGLCRPSNGVDFKEFGGWLKSTTTYKNKPVYFTYCIGNKNNPNVTTQDRLYLDVDTLKIFK